MCNKNTPPKIKSKSMIKINKQTQTTVVSLKPSRKTRTKTRKPKFLSLLRLDSSPETSQQSGEMTHHHHQLNLFPLHPENLVEDKDLLHDENNMAYLFSTSDDTTATTLTGLLDSKAETTISSEEDSVSPPSLTYAYGGGQDTDEGAAGSVSLVRTALRNRERDASEEKWVCYSEVVEGKKKKKVEEEVSSCFADARDYSARTQQRHRLSLKLDYQEILNAWCDKGPLYVEGECPQTVPDLHHDHQFLPHHSGSNGPLDDLVKNHLTVHTISVGFSVLMDGLWRVPENSKIVSMEEEMNGGGDHVGWKIGQREASVLRYKEKRQSRLFSKRIRYEVRKVNAEKRPRMKGRFVKRS